MYQTSFGGLKNLHTRKKRKKHRRFKESSHTKKRENTSQVSGLLIKVYLVFLFPAQGSFQSSLRVTSDWNIKFEFSSLAAVLIWLFLKTRCLVLAWLLFPLQVYNASFSLFRYRSVPFPSSCLCKLCMLAARDDCRHWWCSYTLHLEL